MEDKVIIDDLHAAIFAGTCTVILGPGGSGKSTLFSIIRNELPTPPFAVEGDIAVSTAKIRLLDQHQRWDKAQTPVAVFRSEGYSYPSEVSACWGKFPDFAEKLTAFSNLPLSDVPKKYHKIVAFTLAQAGRNYDLLLLDEPEVNIEDNLAYLITKINELKLKKTVVVNTHHMLLAESIADKVMVLFYGKLKEYATTPDFLTSENPDVQYIIKMGC